MPRIAMTVQPKKIARTTLIGERGVNLVARTVMEMGYVWYPTGTVEAGIDGHIELRDAKTGEVFNSVIGVQSKATEGTFQNETATGFDFYFDERDLDYWLRGNLPVILVVSRPSFDEAYWVSVKDYFRDPTRRRARKVHFEKSVDRFDKTCRDTLFQLAAPRVSGLYLAPALKPERLISNLLPVAFLPAWVYLGDTHMREPREVLAEARRVGGSLGGEWILHNKRILSFRDLRRPEWAKICDQGTVEDFNTEEWSQTDDPDRRREFVDLLRRTLREMVREDLDYHEKLAMFYFRATPDRSPRDVDYQGLAKATDRSVFKGYVADDGVLKYYRHSAFQDRFHRFDDRWHLEITPTYHFTADGYHLRHNYERFLKRIKEIEGHDAVRGQLIMWAAFLTPRGDLFHSDPYPFLGFGEPVTFEADRGIDDVSWDAKREKAHERENGKGTGGEDQPTLPLFGA